MSSSRPNESNRLADALRALAPLDTISREQCLELARLVAAEHSLGNVIDEGELWRGVQVELTGATDSDFQVPFLASGPDPQLRFFTHRALEQGGECLECVYSLDTFTLVSANAV